MSSENKKIVFSAEGNSLLTFVKQAKAEFQGLQKEGKNLAETFASQAKAEGLTGKDAFRFSQDMLKLLKEQLKIQKELTKEKLETNKLLQDELSGNNNKWAVEQRKRLLEEENKLNQESKSIDDKAKQIPLAEAANRQAQQEPRPEKKSFFGDILKAELLRDVLGLMRQGAQAKTGVDLISPVFQAGGALAGSMLSNIPGIGSALGTIAKEGAGIAADLLVRHRYAQEEFNISKNRYLALTGDNRGGSFFDNRDNPALNRFIKNGAAEITSIRRQEKSDGSFLGDIWENLQRTRKDSSVTISQDRANELNSMLNEARAFERRKKRFSNIGVTNAQALDEMTRVSSISGTSRGAEDKAAMSMALEAGFGISRDITSQSLGTQRFGGGSGLINIQKTLGLAIGEGLDKTKWADALKEQVSVLKQFASTSDNIDINRANEVLFKTSRLGGQFAIGNPFRDEVMSGLNEGLSNPKDTFQSAQSNKILRQLYPNASPWQLYKMMKAGTNTTGYAEAVIADNANFGFAAPFMNQGRFNYANPDSIDRLMGLSNQTNPITGKPLTLEEIEAEGAKYKTPLQKAGAEIQDAFKDNLLLGVKAVASSFQDEMLKSIDTLKVAMDQLADGRLFQQDKIPSNVNASSVIGPSSANKKPNLHGG